MNRKVLVRDAPVTTQAMIVTRTVGSVRPVVKLPTTMTILAFKWVDIGKSVDLNRRGLDPTQAAEEMISKCGLPMQEGTIRN